MVFLQIWLSIGAISHFWGLEKPGFVPGVFWIDSSRNMIDYVLELS
jgi:hypothetical protein